LTYGLAKATGQSLLFFGDDFTQTDLHSALGDGSGSGGRVTPGAAS
jgi:hypothetical protein